MIYIDERFKDARPEQTVAKIRGLLAQVGIALEERWTQSGLEHCWSLNVCIPGLRPYFSNGKGVTRELAQASAYAEFIERIQCGLHLFKLQSIQRDPTARLQTHAPDGRYMTLAELEAQGEWMDPIIATYGQGLTRARLAKICQTYDCSPDGRVLTVPYYSVFEDKYVYLPAELMSHLYGSNGCCAGNTRQEAWVHGLSEMMERHSTLKLLLSGQAFPPIPDEILAGFPAVWEILSQVRSTGLYDIQILDVSLGNGLPVVAARLINKQTQEYMVNTGADPVLELAVTRTLTELFQGKKLTDHRPRNGARILGSMSQTDQTVNTMNQLEVCDSLLAADFFAEELTCGRPCTAFEDLSDRTNPQLLEHMLALYRRLGKPLYVRNYSFLGFPTYHFAVPGFSEAQFRQLVEPVQEYALGDLAAKTLRDPASATDAELALLLAYYRKIRGVYSRGGNVSLLTGVPLGPRVDYVLFATLSYAAWRLGRFGEAARELDPAIIRLEDETLRDQFACIRHYLRLKDAGVEEEKIRVILGKFFRSPAVQSLYQNLDAGGFPFEGHLLRCDGKNCQGCAYAADCGYPRLRQIIAATGAAYARFTGGQSREHFTGGMDHV